MGLSVQLISGLAMGCIYGLVAIGFSMIYRAMSLVNFAQADIVMLGAFMGFTLLSAFPFLPFWVVLVLSMIGTGAVGFALEKIIFQRAVERKAGLVYLVLLTLGIGIVLSNGARLIWGANPVVYPIPLTHQMLMIAGYPLPLVHVYIIVTMAILLIGLQLMFTRTWVGVALRAAADDPETARTMGINTKMTSALSFAIASGIAAAAGVLFAPIAFVSFDMGVIGIKAFAAAVVGTLGSIPGALVGGLLIGVGESVGAQLLSPEFQDSIALGMMIVILLFRPTGLFAQAR